ncbi:MAG: Ig-like domain-containing protein, partial [Solirubrobacterales bacterium]
MAFLHKLAQRLARIKAALIVAVVAAIACEVPLADPSSNVGQLQLAPKTSSLRTGQTVKFVAFALTPAGDTAIMSVRWSTTGGSMVDTSTTGGRHYLDYKSPDQPGQYKVITQSVIAGLSDSAVVNVSAVPVASVNVTPGSANVVAGQTVQLTANTLDSTGAALSGRVVTWVSNNTAIATVNASGLVTGVAAGSATLTATSEGKSGTVAVTVTPVPVASVGVSPGPVSVTVGQTVQLTATPRDAGGNALTGRVVTWGSSNTGIATVNGSGLVTGVAAGSATITATSEGKSGTAAITVTLTAAPVASVSVTPASASVTAGQTVQLTATPRDAGGNVLVGRVVTWGSSNTGLATVNGGGLVTGVAAGSATITATSEGQSGSSAISVIAPVASVSVTPPSATVTAGRTVQLTATPRDAGGNALTGRVVTWGSSNT